MSAPDKKSTAVIAAQPTSLPAMPTTPAQATPASALTRDADGHPGPATMPALVEPARGTKWHWWRWALGGVVLALIGFYGVPWLIRTLNTVSTDDAYVNGHVTFVAPRVAGQVLHVLVDDNNRVNKGDLLVQLDPEPYQIQVNIARAAVAAAEADLVTAQAQARATIAEARSQRFNLEHAIEDVNNQIALLRLKVATLQAQKASLDRAQADYERATQLVQTKAISREEFDQRKQAFQVAQAQRDEALQGVYQVRVGLGLSPKPASGDDLAQVPSDLEQTYSSVRQAQAGLMKSVAKLGVVQFFDKTPKEMVAEFYKRDPKGDIERIYADILKDAPAIKQAETKLAQAQRNLDQAELNLRYCNVFAEIDGVITRRNVNPGNNVIAGQSLMALRSLTDIWIDANFKETQLADLRIGHPVEIEVDMYGSRQSFKGRISGFTMGTGSTLALLPPENATGNFVKVVQRLPVRIDLVDYDPEKAPLFIGLSVTPYVLINETPAGADAGKVLQPHLATLNSTPATPAKQPGAKP